MFSFAIPRYLVCYDQNVCRSEGIAGLSFLRLYSGLVQYGYMKMLVKFEDTDLLEARCRAHTPPEDFGIQFRGFGSRRDPWKDIPVYGIFGLQAILWRNSGMFLDMLPPSWIDEDDVSRRS